MEKQFAASEVRRLSNRIPRSNDEIADAQEALRAFADLLEAQEKAVPVVWVNPDDLANPYFVGIGAAKAAHQDLGRHYTQPLYTHPVPADAITPRELAKRIERGEKWKLADEPTPCQSQNAERLAEALRRTCRKMKTFSRTGALDGAVAVWVDEIESVLAAHSAQAQPPAASVTDESVLVPIKDESWPPIRVIRAMLDCQEADPADGSESEAYYGLRAAMKEWQAALAAQENPNG